MENWHNRLKEIREKHSKTQQDIALVLNKDVTRMSRYERGEGAKTMPAFMKKGLAVLFSKEEIAYIDTGEYLTEQNNLIADAGVLYKGKEDQISIPFHKEVYASAGGGSENHSMENTSPITFSKHFLNTYLGVYNLKGISIINAAGDSMDPTIKSGELMFVYAMDNEDFKDGGIYVLMCANVLLVKRVTYDPLSKQYTLLSDNGKVDAVTLTIDEANDCRFVGRVVGHLDRV